MTDGLKAKRTQMKSESAKMLRQLRPSIVIQSRRDKIKLGRHARNTKTPIRPELVAASDTGESAYNSAAPAESQLLSVNRDRYL